MAETDERWLDALAGARAPLNAQEQREQDALRRAARALEHGPVDELAEQRLLQRLEREGLLAPRRVKARLGMRHVARAAVVLLCLGLGLEWLLFMPPAPEPMAPVADQAPKAEPALKEAPAEALQAPAPPAQKQRSATSAEEGMADDTLAPRFRRVIPEVRSRPPLQRLAVAEPSRVREALLELVRTQPGITLQESPEPPDALLLRCDDQAACAALNDWLQAQGQGAGFLPGQPRLLQLVPQQ